MPSRRRAVAGVIDFIVAVVLGSEIWHMPLGDALTPTNWMTETGQATVLTTVGLLIVLGTAAQVFVRAVAGKDHHGVRGGGPGRGGGGRGGGAGTAGGGSCRRGRSGRHYGGYW